MKPQTKSTNSPTQDRNTDGHSDSVQIRKPSLSKIAVMVLGCLGLAAGITMLDHHLKILKNELNRCELLCDDIDAPPCISDMSTCNFGEGVNR